jgi:polysaccharide biosynthesis PFTS motif protein
MIDHKSLLERIYGVLNPKLDKSIRVQISRRILGLSFTQILNARKLNSEVYSLSGPDFGIDFDLGRFNGSFKLTFKTYSELFYSFLQYILILSWKQPSLRNKSLSEFNLFFGYHFPTSPLKECEIQLQNYLNFFGQSQGLGSIFFVERSKHFQKPRRIQMSFFTFSPVLSLLISIKSPLFRVRVFFRLLLELSFYVLIIPVLGPRQLVIRDLFLQKWLVDLLSQQELSISLFTQNLIFNRGFPTASRNMIWYSASAINRELEDEWYIDKTLYLHLPIDCHYVWTLEHANYLEQSGTCQARVVGPQLFYLPSANSGNLTRKKTIAVMDLTPTNWSLYDATYYGVDRGIWFLDTLCAALLDFDLVDNDIQVEFKFKRELSSHHSELYVEKVQALNDLGLFSLVDPNINLYDYFCEVDCLITTQLTSVGLVAESMGVDVIYLDPFEPCVITRASYPRNSSELAFVIGSRETLFG